MAEKSVNREVGSEKQAQDFESMAKDFHRKPALTAAKDAVLNWAGGRYEYKPGGKGDKKKPIREVAGI